MVELTIKTRSQSRSLNGAEKMDTVLIQDAEMHLDIQNDSAVCAAYVSDIVSQNLDGMMNGSIMHSTPSRISTRSMSKTPLLTLKEQETAVVTPLKWSPESGISVQSSSSLLINSALPSSASSSTTTSFLDSPLEPQPQMNGIKRKLDQYIESNVRNGLHNISPSATSSQPKNAYNLRIKTAYNASESSVLSNLDTDDSDEYESALSDMDEDELNNLGSESIYRQQPLKIRKKSLNQPDKYSSSALSSPRFASEYDKVAFLSRLNAYELHPDEHSILRSHINHTQVTIYLNIRNKILKQWHSNVKALIPKEQAAEFVSEPRFMELADIAWEFLVRHGYINYGCISHPEVSKSRKTVAVVGAGIAGLVCVRQLNYLFWQFKDRFPTPEDVPQVVLLEGRERLGGRVYSHPLKSSATAKQGSKIPFVRKPRVDVGAQVITGLDGNPISAVIHQQKLAYHEINPNMAIYDIDGREVEKEEDDKVDVLYNDSLDRVAIFKAKTPSKYTVRAISEILVDEGRDPIAEGGRMSLAEAEDLRDFLQKSPGLSPTPQGFSSLPRATRDFITSPPTTVSSDYRVPVADMIRKGRWTLKDSVKEVKEVVTQPVCDQDGNAVLGKSMNFIFEQYQNMLDILPLHKRLLNWHHANNEYANAAPNDMLSLAEWDQDEGNSFEGPHALLQGGYSRLAESLAESVKNAYTNCGVRNISYDNKDLSKDVIIEWEKAIKMDVPAIASGHDTRRRGTTEYRTVKRNYIEAEKVVVTAPLGCLKAQQIKFEPQLPEWKQTAIENMGYGLLNKVILIFDEPFWDMTADMFGLLREPLGDPTKLASYEANRGRFYMFWNVSMACGRPALVGLMTGDAAIQVESETDQALAEEAMGLLSKIYSDRKLVDPVEVVVTRWAQDPFSLGSYSYMGPRSSGEDYDNMAKAVDGKLFFAGEATCRTHPATVHGAFISGLRAAEEVLRSYIGEIPVPTPLMMPKATIEKELKKKLPSKRKAEDEPIKTYYRLKRQRVETYEQGFQQAVVSVFGEPPKKPSHDPTNPWLLYLKDNWENAKAECDKMKRRSSRNVNAQAKRDEIRGYLSRKWKNASPREKGPYMKQANAAKADLRKEMKTYKKKVEEYKSHVDSYLEMYKRTFACPLPSIEEEKARTEAEELMTDIRRLCRLSGIRLEINEHGDIITSLPERSPG